MGNGREGKAVCDPLREYGDCMLCDVEFERANRESSRQDGDRLIISVWNGACSGYKMVLQVTNLRPLRAIVTVEVVKGLCNIDADILAGTVELYQCVRFQPHRSSSKIFSGWEEAQSVRLWKLGACTQRRRRRCVSPCQATT